MNLPNAHLAIIDPAKVHGYLLSETHPIGRFKAAFFLSLGYTAARWGRLRDDILTMIEGQEAIPGAQSPFGQKFDVDGMLKGPDGVSARIRTVWIVPNDDQSPRLITAFPR